jgi:hypothetical protein
MTEEKYYAGEFTDGELNCQADLADYRKAAAELYRKWLENSGGNCSIPMGSSEVTSEDA